MPSNKNSASMRSASEILDYLDTFYTRMIQRPSMYTPSPSAMGCMIVFIEDLRAFVLNEDEQENRFISFEKSLGYGAMGCSHADGTVVRISDEEMCMFRNVANVLKLFLVQQGRLDE